MADRIVSTDMPFTVMSMEADRDYLLARMLSFVGGGFHSRAGFVAQQACEKYMKAFTVHAAKKYLQTHKLLDLAKACAPFSSYFDEAETKRILKNFDYFEQVGRYGGAANFDPLAKKSPEVETAGVMVWMHDYLRELDAFVHEVRGSLKFERSGMDFLNAILQGRTDNLFVATWTGKPSLREILVRENYYFGA